MLVYKCLNYYIFSDDPDTDSSEESDDFETVSSIVAGNNIHSADFSSESFRSLPPETQHEILLQLKDTKKQSSWNSMHEMPEVCVIFCIIMTSIANAIWNAVCCLSLV